MSYADYMKANKEGKKQYNKCVSHGQFPYLPVLDDMISVSDIECEMNLGVQFIPLERVVGTASFGRTTAFSNNFMPLLDYETEFGTKWSALCDAQAEEGILHAIKVYEYMNRYYVIEGNKRVSVLKFYGAVNVAAEVLRKIPKRTDELENKIYYEYMAFQKLSGINYVWFTQEGRFTKLQELVKGNLEDAWDDTDRENFSSFRINFRKQFSALGGKKLPITEDDALLSFIETYEYTDVLEMPAAELKASLEKYWDEITLLTTSDAQALSMNPTEEKEAVTKNVLRFILPLPVSQKKTKVAFIYDKNPETSGWIYSHELGRNYLEEHLGDTVETKSVVCSSESDQSEHIMEDLIQEGYQIIFTTTPNLSKSSLKAAVDHPDIRVLNCSLNISNSHVRSYYTRMYELKFLTGMIAGAMVENDKIGYVADYPIFGTTANINAFALGAKLVNPRARIYLTWEALRDHNIEAYFKFHDIRYISNKDMIHPEDGNRQFGLYQLAPQRPEKEEGSIDSSSDTDPDAEHTEIISLAMSVCHWGVFYEKLIKSILSGSFNNNDASEKKKPLNYWWGLSAGVLELFCSNKIPEQTQRLVHMVQEQICKDEFQVFSGKICDQDGNVILDDDKKTLSPDEIIEMDWLCDNVIGYIPTFDQLSNQAKPVVKVQGVTTASSENEILTTN